MVCHKSPLMHAQQSNPLNPVQRLNKAEKRFWLLRRHMNLQTQNMPPFSCHVLLCPFIFCFSFLFHSPCLPWIISSSYSASSNTFPTPPTKVKLSTRVAHSAFWNNRTCCPKLGFMDIGEKEYLQLFYSKGHSSLNKQSQ